MTTDNQSKDSARESLITKELAEAEKARAEGEAALIRARAEAAKFQGEAEKAKAEAREKVAQAALAEITLIRENRHEVEELASNKYHQVYSLVDSINQSSVDTCIKQLNIWHRNDPSCAIEIIFHSPGGSVIPGFALFDYIQYLRGEGHYITTTAMGMAASMAGILLQAGDKRIMGAEAWILIHEIAFGAVGKIGEVEDTTLWAKKIQKRVLDIFAKRSHMKAGQIARKWKRKDWWIDSTEAKRLGLVDEVR